MEYRGKFGYTIGLIQHINIMSIIEICYTSCLLGTKTVELNLAGFQGLKRCIQYLASHPHKPIIYPYNSGGGSNVIILTYSGDQF